jgi:hypothetical protein
MFGFIIVRHINNNISADYWIHCYNHIRKYYDNNIIIIDDNSDISLIKNIETVNCKVINSEFTKGKGEILGYYYFYKLKPFDKAIIIHDSVFINKKIDFNNICEINFLWSFEKNKWDNSKHIKMMLNKYNNELYNNYINGKWDYGCYGIMSVIDYDFINLLNKKFNILKLINIINNREDRMAFERIFAIMCFTVKSSINVMFDTIHSYCEWGLTYNDYINNKNNIKKLPIIKIWSGR